MDRLDWRGMTPWQRTKAFLTEYRTGRPKSGRSIAVHAAIFGGLYTLVLWFLFDHSIGVAVATGAVFALVNLGIELVLNGRRMQRARPSTE